MTLKLPPLHVVFPPNAIYRKYPLPPDLKETWEILRGLAWVNKYSFTPPASLDELLQFHHNLKRRALEYRLERLERTGWLTVRRASGKANLYVTTVPEDKPIDYSVQAAVHGGEPTSLRGVSPEESARSATGSEIEGVAGVSHKTPAMDCTSFFSTVVVDKLDSSLNVQTTTSTNTTPATDCTGVRTIFESAFIQEPQLTKLAQTVSEQNARDWVTHWLPNAPQSFTDPVAFMVKHLLSDPTEPPPQRYRRHNDLVPISETLAELTALQKQAEEKYGIAEPLEECEEAPSEVAPCPYVQDHASDLWHSTLGELQLQMTKATFDTWVRPSRVLGWDGDTLVVSVHSPYAKEWIENRLETTIQRTLTGIVGKAVMVRYEIVDQNQLKTITRRIEHA